jgi:hypothetical protein
MPEGLGVDDGEGEGEGEEEGAGGLLSQPIPSPSLSCVPSVVWYWWLSHVPCAAAGDVSNADAANAPAIATAPRYVNDLISGTRG